MKMTSLVIKADRSWNPVGSDNPLRAVVQLQDDKSSIEVVLSEDSMRRMIDLCADEIAEQARQRVGEFVQAVNTLENGKSQALIGDA